MLDTLYKRLHYFFISAIMLIITIILIVMSVHHVQMETLNERMYFQRMAAIATTQLSEDIKQHASILQAYENNYHIVSVMKKDEKLLYHSKNLSSLKASQLIKEVQQQVGIATAKQQTSHVTIMQGGIASVGKDKPYWAIPITFLDKATTYELLLFYPQQSYFTMLQTILPLYLGIWLISCIGVRFISHFVLHKALEPTEQVLKSQKEFVAAASHELKAPLALLMANVEKLAETKPLDNPMKQQLQVMDRECMRMAQLIKDMLFLATCDAKTWSLHEEMMDVDTLLFHLYETYEPMCLQHHIELYLHEIETPYPNLYTDEERVFQILGIFLDNAIHHAQTSSIEIQTDILKKEVIFQVIDHGIGIAEAERENIFKRFYCVDKAHADKNHYGLGLSIVQELAKGLQGKVTCTNTLHGGTTFSLYLPRRKEQGSHQ